jgi:transposase-like protein
MGRRNEAPREFTAEFKVEAVRLMRERLAAGVTLVRIGQELEIKPDRLRSWAEIVDASPPGTPPRELFPGKGNYRSVAVPPKSPGPLAGPLPLEEEVARLRRENERLRMERDFLKKATAYFAKESR